MPSDYDIIKLMSDVYRNVGHSLNFIQVGACDGDFLNSNDPIQQLLKEKHWHGVMLEPVPFLFEKLKINIEKYLRNTELQSRIHLMNAALSSENGKQNFYIVNDKFIKEKQNETHAFKFQIGSFNKNHIEKHLIKLKNRNELSLGVDDYINMIEVRGVTADMVIKEYKESNKAIRDGFIDILMIDAEGYDFQVLKNFMQIESIRPNIVIYEILHMSKQNQNELQKFMENLGYLVWTYGWNNCAVRVSELSNLYLNNTNTNLQQNLTN